MKRHHFKWSIPLFVFLGTALLFLTLTRISLVIWQYDRVAEAQGLWFVIFQGIRFDLVLLAQLLAIPFIVMPFLALHEKTRSVMNIVLRVYLALLAGYLVFVEAVTPNFILQYDLRPNYLFVEYLIYPKEVFSMLIKTVPVQLGIAIGITVFLAWKMFILLKKQEQHSQNAVLWSAPLLSIAGIIVCLAFARSTLGHRPVNPSTVAFSSDPLINSLPLSSAYSVAYALYEKVTHEKDGIPTYGKMDDSQMLKEIYGAMELSSNQFGDSKIPTLHKQSIGKSTQAVPRKNLVIILQESLGADFVGSLGGMDVTPNIDKLSKEGMWFTNLYATGTRSVRGIEAVVTGFPPTPASSVVKLGGSQNNFFTIAELLSREGFDTSFIYGGEAHFDNMRRFFVNNGFKRIIEEKDYQNPAFKGSWGVSDEDLFNKAHETFSQLSEENTPFFSLVFTSSNHPPFEYPEDRITLAEYPPNTVSNAVKYADYALGNYIETAKRSSYWKDTVFLIIADHSDRVYGNELVPINKFRIPGLILGENIPAKEISRVSSQIDMLPTMLSMIGVESAHPAIGIDLTREDIDSIPGRAIMQFSNTQAYMEDDKVVIFQPDHSPEQFNYVNERLVKSESEPTLVKRALAHSLWPVKAYTSKSYHLPKTELRTLAEDNTFLQHQP